MATEAATAAVNAFVKPFFIIGSLPFYRYMV
jgi:hypothetical protein